MDLSSSSSLPYERIAQSDAVVEKSFESSAKSRAKEIGKAALKALKCVAFVFTGLVVGIAASFVVMPIVAIGLPAFLIRESLKVQYPISIKVGVILGSPLIAAVSAIASPILVIGLAAAVGYKKAMAKSSPLPPEPDFFV